MRLVSGRCPCASRSPRIRRSGCEVATTASMRSRVVGRVGVRGEEVELVAARAAWARSRAPRSRPADRSRRSARCVPAPRSRGGAAGWRRRGGRASRAAPCGAGRGACRRRAGARRAGRPRPGAARAPAPGRGTCGRRPRRGRGCGSRSLHAVVAERPREAPAQRLRDALALGVQRAQVVVEVLAGAVDHLLRDPALLRPAAGPARARRGRRTRPGRRARPAGALGRRAGAPGAAPRAGRPARAPRRRSTS